MSSNISVVIPSYKVSKHIEGVVKGIPVFVSYIIVVDDKCPQGSGKIVEALCDARVVVCYHERNLGVGGAVVTGYKKALELNSDVIVKLDGDGQMDVSCMQKLVEPILNGRADYTKGNRFKDFKALGKMPKVRLFGNSGLSFLVKVASGYWNLMDPTNGYTAGSKNAIGGLDLDSLAKGYFFESDMLIKLNIENAVVEDVEIPARYGDEESSLAISGELMNFPPKLLKGFCRRIFLKYFIYDFNMVSLYVAFGVPMFLFGVLFGLLHWMNSLATDVEATTGTVMLSVLPIILGVQFLLQAVQIDMSNIPRKDK